MGSDWAGKFDELQEYCDVVYLDRTKEVSSTDIKKSLKRLVSINPADLQIALDVLNQIRQDME
jgi:glycerol-3-phosphate cytidylyltransferase